MYLVMSLHFPVVSECSLGTGHVIHCIWTENKEYTVPHFFTLYTIVSYMTGKKAEERRGLNSRVTSSKVSICISGQQRAENSRVL